MEFTIVEGARLRFETSHTYVMPLIINQPRLIFRVNLLHLPSFNSDAYRCVGCGVVVGLGCDGGGSCGGGHRHRGVVGVVLVVGDAARRPHDVLDPRVHLQMKILG